MGRGSRLSPGARLCPGLHVFTNLEAPRAIFNSRHMVRCKKKKKKMYIPEEREVGKGGSSKPVCLPCLGVTAAGSLNSTEYE